MLPNLTDNKMVPTINPYRRKVDVAAVAVVTAEQLEKKALDAFLLADAARGSVFRRMRDAEQVHTSQGAYLIDRTTGQRIPDEELERAERQRGEAESAYLGVSATASRARWELLTVQKASEIWERTATYWAGQAEQEASLTPAERELRARRDAGDRERTAR